MKKSSYSNLVLCVFLMALTGCIPPQYLILQNKTGNDIQVEWIDVKVKKIIILKSNKKLKILYPSNTMEIRIITGVTTRTYKLLWPPLEFIKESFNAKKIYYQIASDYDIYIIKSYEFKTIPKQPKGYPIQGVSTH